MVIFRKMRTFQLLGTNILVLEQGEAMRHTIEGMGGRALVFVMRKTLTRSDVAVHQGRLFITNDKVLRGQLSEEEQTELKTSEGYVNVEVVDPRGEGYEMKLKEWKSLKMFVLTSGWNRLVNDNELEAEIHCIELWSFRVGLKLCFAFGLLNLLCILMWTCWVFFLRFPLK